MLSVCSAQRHHVKHRPRPARPRSWRNPPGPRAAGSSSQRASDAGCCSMYGRSTPGYSSSHAPSPWPRRLLHSACFFTRAIQVASLLRGPLPTRGDVGGAIEAGTAGRTPLAADLPAWRACGCGSRTGCRRRRRRSRFAGTAHGQYREAGPAFEAFRDHLVAGDAVRGLGRIDASEETVRRRRCPPVTELAGEEGRFPFEGRFKRPRPIPAAHNPARSVRAWP